MNLSSKFSWGISVLRNIGCVFVPSLLIHLSRYQKCFCINKRLQVRKYIALKNITLVANGCWHKQRSCNNTFGTELFHSPSLLHFDQFYLITFKPITASIFHCDHMGWYERTWHIHMIWQIWSGLNYVASTGFKTKFYSCEKGS